MVERVNGIHEVVGSNPIPSTSLRPQPCEGEGCPAVDRDVCGAAKADPAAGLRLGMPATSYHYVYILVSEQDSTRHYTGCTTDLKARLVKHNAGEVPHTSKYRPWSVETAIAFRSREKARAFEQYLKTGSGREFARRHL